MLLALLFSANVACAPTVLHGAWELLEQAGWGTSDRERAAFVVLGTDGELQLSPWPYRARSMEASTNTLPEGTIAILHTHPNERRNPSPDDVAVARRLGVPVVVVTRQAIRVATGTSVEAVWSGDWNPDAPRAHTTCR